MVEVIRLNAFRLPPPSEKHFARSPYHIAFCAIEYEITEIYRLSDFAGLDMADIISALPPDSVNHRVEAPDYNGLKLTVHRSVSAEVFQEELRYASLPGAVGTVTVML